MKKNLITYENYRNHMERFGHVATWALWNDEAISTSPSDIDKIYSIKEELIIANSEENYREKGLDRLLHGDVVIVPLNFSRPKESRDNPNSLLEILNKYKDSKHNRKRYDKLVKLTSEDERYLFFNMYGDSAKNYGPGFMKSDFLHGAYMTDFVKFVEEDDELIAAGIPESNSSDDIIKEELDERVNIHARGLKEEFDLLGIEPKAIVLCSSKLYTRNKEGELGGKVIDAITEALGYRPSFLSLNHYTARGSVKKGEFNSEAEAFENREIPKLDSQLKDIIR